MTRSMLLLLGAAAIVGCNDKADTDPVDSDSGPPVITIETGDYIDTSDTDTDPPDTGDTGAVADRLSSVALYPADLVVHPGASFSLRAMGTWASGAVDELTAAYASSDAKIAAVDKDGNVTAIAAGSVELTATADGISGAVSLTVADDGMVHVSVISATSGEPLEGVKVKVGEGDQLSTPKDGTLSIPVDDGGGPIEVTAYGAAYMPATVWGTVSRQVTIPVHTDEEFWASNARLEGDVDFSGVDEGSLGELTIGLVVPSFRYGPLLIEPDDLMAEDRTVEIFGLKTDIPSNLSLKEHAEGYAASTPAATGHGAAWVIAGALPVGDITAALDADTSDTEGALSLLGEHIDELRWGWASADGLSSGETCGVDVLPSVRFSSSVQVQTGPLPGGFAGTEEPLVMVGRMIDDAGVVVTGLALGAGDVSVPAVPGSNVDGATGTVAMGIAQIGGLGSGGAISAAWGPVVDGAAELPLYQNTPSVTSFDAVSHDFEMWTDPRSDYVRVVLQSRDGTARILYMPGGEVAGMISDPGFPMGYAVVIWRILSLETTGDTFEGMVRSGELVASEQALKAWTSTQANITTSAAGGN